MDSRFLSCSPTEHSRYSFQLVIPDLGPESNQVTKGYCAPYNGQVCRHYLVGRGLVWFNISQDNSGGWLNEQITQNLWNDLIVKLKEPCRSSAEVSLGSGWNRLRCPRMHMSVLSWLVRTVYAKASYDLVKLAISK